jgi:hypothetical protein
MRKDYYILETGEPRARWEAYCVRRTDFFERVKAFAKSHGAANVATAANPLGTKLVALIFKGARPPAWRKFEGEVALQPGFCAGAPRPRFQELVAEFDAFRLPPVVNDLDELFSFGDEAVTEGARVFFPNCGKMGDSIVLVIPRNDSDPIIQAAGARLLKRWEFEKLVDEAKEAAVAKLASETAPHPADAVGGSDPEQREGQPLAK